MQEEGVVKAEYDNLPVNPIVAEIEAGVAGDGDSKNKQRRYWTAKEEQCFHEIWGRENWRLTKHGKNTVFFAQWAEELKDRFGIDIRPEEVQAKVNQTRAKFRSVKKQANFDKNGPRWKKFDIIDKILKNKYRPKDAEPIPPDVLRKNRDISPDLDDEVLDESQLNTQQPTTPSSLSSNSKDATQITTGGVILSTEQNNDLNNSTMSDHDISANLFNANELQPNPEYGSQLYAEIKEEFQPDYHQASYPTTYGSDQNHFPSPIPDEPPQLLELQTPQQQQQMQHQQQYSSIGASSTVGYEHHQTPTNAAYSSTSAEQVNLYNNQSHYSNASTAASAPPQQQQPQHQQQQQQQQNYNNNGTQQYGAITYANTNNITNTNNGIMQPPARPVTQAIAPRKRGRTPGSSYTNHSLNANEISLESVYIEEVRKRNAILDEQKEIARKRLAVEERKIALMEQFFPKFLESQAKILDKLQNGSVNNAADDRQ